MLQTVSKSQFKTKALAYFREVEKKQKEFVVTHNGKPVANVIPHKQATGKKDEEILKLLRGSVLRYDNPTEPVGEDDWEALK